MHHLKNKLTQLLGQENLSDQEKNWILSYIETSSGNEALQEIMQQKFDEHLEAGQQSDNIFSKDILKLIHKRINVSAEKPNILWLWSKRITIAASLIGIFSLVTYFYYTKGKDNPIQNNTTVSTYGNDVPAGSKKAVLTLANGSNIILNDTKNGTIFHQGDATIVKANGKLSYANQKLITTQTVYNTLSTPRAGKYQLELPDGSMVWLNSESTIRFPTTFTGQERRVEISGEAYFEIAKSKIKPFIVKVDKSEVRVFGTHFNVTAYKNESVIKTTLLEGSVQFVNNQSTYMLRPGEQSILTDNGMVTKKAHINVADVIAWKNGFFHFENADIETVMQQLGRWYDVKVVYNKKVNDTFYAEVPTSSNLSEVLKVLELTGKVQFEIKGKNIIVNP